MTAALGGERKNNFRGEDVAALGVYLRAREALMRRDDVHQVDAIGVRQQAHRNRAPESSMTFDPILVGLVAAPLGVVWIVIRMVSPAPAGAAAEPASRLVVVLRIQLLIAVIAAIAAAVAAIPVRLDYLALALAPGMALSVIAAVEAQGREIAELQRQVGELGLRAKH